MMLIIVCGSQSSESVYYNYQINIIMPSNTLKKFGNRVREERLKQGFSQEKLASKAGVHRTYIGMIERAEKNITLENIEKIALALKINLSDIFRD
jgi:ribosome-binding protein aMBF1 (putative translation factor)